MALGGSTHGKVWVERPKVHATPARNGDCPRVITVIPNGSGVSAGGNACVTLPGRKELACGSQAPIATLLFDPSMSALPIIVKHNSQRVGLFTR